MNEIRLADWYCQPVHCPFFGTPLDWSEQNLGCRHLLYAIGEGNFLSRSTLFTKLAGIAQIDDDGGEISKTEIARLGDPVAIANAVRDRLTTPNMAYQLVDPGGYSYIGYSAFEDELCGWGRDSKSPYSDEPG